MAPEHTGCCTPLLQQLPQRHLTARNSREISAELPARTPWLRYYKALLKLIFTVQTPKLTGEYQAGCLGLGFGFFPYYSYKFQISHA